MLVVVKAPQTTGRGDRRLAAARSRDLQLEFASLGDLVGGEDHQRLVPGGGLLACGCLALVVVADLLVLGQGEHQARDARAKAGVEIGELGRGLLDLSVFFTRSAASQEAGVETLGRLTARRDDRDTLTTWQTRQAQYDAVCDWGIPDHGQLRRVRAIGMPVLVANGDSDPMILPHFSYLLAGLIPQARVRIYPDAAHGFLFQYHAEFSRDVDAFLTE